MVSLLARPCHSVGKPPTVTSPLQSGAVAGGSPLGGAVFVSCPLLTALLPSRCLIPWLHPVLPSLFFCLFQSCSSLTLEGWQSLGIAGRSRRVCLPQPWRGSSPQQPQCSLVLCLRTTPRNTVLRLLLLNKPAVVCPQARGRNEPGTLSRVLSSCRVNSICSILQRHSTAGRSVYHKGRCSTWETQNF